MSSTCLNCGKPLGNRTTLCYGCESDGVSPEDIVDPDEEIRERVERYFIVSSLKCADCGEIHGVVTVDGTEYTAADFAIETLEEWEQELDKEEAWMTENREAVEQTLPTLQDEWPQTVDAVQRHVL